MSYDSIPAFLSKRRGPLRRLAEALDDICENGDMALVRGEDGLTFVLPTNEEAETLVSQLKSEDVDLVGEALEALRARAIPLYLPSCDEWRARCVRGEGVGTRSGFLLPEPEEPKKKSQRKSKSLTVGGIKIRPNDKFSSPHRISVWKVDEPKDSAGGAGGDVAKWPLGGAPWSPPRIVSDKPRPRQRAQAVDRVALLRKYGEKWAANMEEVMEAGFLPLYARDPFLIACASLFDYLQARDPEAYRAVLPLASPIPAITLTTAIGIQSDVISTRTLAGWARAPRIDERTARERYIYHLTAGLREGSSTRGSSGPAPHVCSPEGQLLLDRARIRVAASAPKGSQTRLAKYLVNTYKEVATLNSFGGVAPMYPVATLKHLGPERNRGNVLAMIDTIRFILGVHIHEAFSMPAADQFEVPEIIRELFGVMVPTYLDYKPTDAQTILENTLLNFVPQSTIDRKRAFKVIEFFVMTDAFMSYPHEEIIGGVVVRGEKTPDAVVEPLLHRSFPKASGEEKVFSFEWTYARYLAENYHRGQYRTSSVPSGSGPHGTTGGTDIASVAMIAGEAATGDSVTVAATESLAPGSVAPERDAGTGPSSVAALSDAESRHSREKKSRKHKSKKSRSRRSGRKHSSRHRRRSPSTSSSSGSSGASSSSDSD